MRHEQLAGNGGRTTKIAVLTGKIRADCWMDFTHFIIKNEDNVWAQTLY